LALSGAKDYNFAMIDLIQSVPANESLLLVLGIISVLFFIITLTVIPWLILQIPEDYFTEEKRHPLLNEMHHPVVKIILLILKNLAGAFFLLLGIALLVLPGQGLLTMLLGIVLIDFPGKYKLQRWFVQHKSILHSINWLRKKGNRPPIQI